MDITNTDNQIKRAFDEAVSDREKVLLAIKDKAKKLTGALYRVTDLMSDKEPLKWTLRNKGVVLYDGIVSFEFAKGGSGDAVKEIMNALSQIVNVLDLCAGGSSISVINFEILRREYSVLKALIEGNKEAIVAEPFLLAEVSSLSGSGEKEEEKETEGLIAALSGGKNEDDALRDSAVMEFISFSSVSDIGHKMDIGGGMNMSDSDREVDDDNDRDDVANGKIKKGDNGGKTVKISADLDPEERRKKILEFLRKNGEKTIGEIALIFKGKMSTKTIQRDLSELTSRGALSAKGEKRWRSYAINGNGMSQKKEYL